MARSIRVLSGPVALTKMWQAILSIQVLQGFGCVGSPAIGNGGTAGRLRTTASSITNVAGVQITKASTDDLWNLSAEVDTIAAQFRAYWLFIDASGTATIAAGSNAASAAAALAALPALVDTKGVVGVYVAGAATDFDAAGGLAAQGTIHNGIPTGAAIGGGYTYIRPEVVTLVKA